MNKLNLKNINRRLTALRRQSFYCCAGIAEVAQERFHKSVNKYLQNYNSEDHADIIALAKEKFQYITATEIQEQTEKYRRDGMYSHGLEVGCCQFGCGEVD